MYRKARCHLCFGAGLTFRSWQQEINRCFDNYNALLAKPVVRGDDLDEPPVFPSEVCAAES